MGRFFRENLSLSFDAADSVAAGLFKHHCVAQIKQKHVYIYICIGSMGYTYIHTYIYIYYTPKHRPNYFQTQSFPM